MSGTGFSGGCECGHCARCVGEGKPVGLFHDLQHVQKSELIRVLNEATALYRVARRRAALQVVEGGLKKVRKRLKGR